MMGTARHTNCADDISGDKMVMMLMRGSYLSLLDLTVFDMEIKRILKEAPNGWSNLQIGCHRGFIVSENICLQCDKARKHLYVLECTVSAM